MVGTAQPALLAFPAERPVFVREYSTNHYSVFAYFMSRLIVEATVTALQVVKIVRFSFCAVSAYFLRRHLIEHTVRWHLRHSAQLLIP